MALTFAIGCVVFVAGFLKLGMVIDFISTPNLNGFIQASALMVMVSMTPKLIGVSVAKSPVIYKMVPRTIEALPVRPHIEPSHASEAHVVAVTCSSLCALM